MSSIRGMLAQKILANHERVRAWYQTHAQAAPPPFYCSVDLRDAGFKISPVDSNLYPAGFNNICPTDQQNAPELFAELIKRRFPKGLEGNGTRKILILPEGHTQNTYYIENLYNLKEILKEAGFEVEIGWFPSRPDLPGEIPLQSASGKTLTARLLTVQSGMARAGEFVPDLIVLNNDFSGGYPELLDQISQPITPSHSLGWHTRLKSDHFKIYNQLAAEFANLIEIDPWLIQVDTQAVEHVNFNEEQGTTEVESVVHSMLERTAEAYRRHGITKAPFVFIKNNSGTYGMGIMVAHSSDEIKTMNRRTKNKMSVGKNRKPIDSVVVQEGVPSVTTINKITAEPVIYIVGCELIGGFLRANTQRGAEENLNSEGMVFRKLCVSDLRDMSQLELSFEENDPKDMAYQEPILELVYGAIARISALAAGIELLQHPARVKSS